VFTRGGWLVLPAGSLSVPTRRRLVLVGDGGRSATRGADVTADVTVGGPVVLVALVVVGEAHQDYGRSSGQSRGSATRTVPRFPVAEILPRGAVAESRRSAAAVWCV